MEFFASGSALYRLQSPFLPLGVLCIDYKAPFLPLGVLCIDYKAPFLPPAVLCIDCKATFLPPGVLCIDCKATFLPPGVLCIDCKAHHRLHPFPYTLYIYTRAGALVARVVGVRAIGDSTLYAADGHCAAIAPIACADAVGSTISHCSSHFGYA